MSVFPSDDGPADDADLDAAMQALRDHSYALTDGLLPPVLLQALHRECLQLARSDALVPAATGRGAERVLDRERRGDAIRWLGEAPVSDAQRRFLEAMDELRQRLNRGLMLGLEQVEAHFALYPPGTGYVRHLDRFRDDDTRVVSLVCYLDEGWTDGNGGELRLHLPAGPRDIAPCRGTTVIFLSAEVEHEVLATRRERSSIAAWFRRRALTRRR